jgi:AraC-like DNA-binding protein
MKRWTSPEIPFVARPSQPTTYTIEDVANHQEHEINVALRGEAIYRMGDDDPITLTAGDILLFPAGVLHGIEVPKALSMLVFHFHPDVFRGLREVFGAGDTLNRLSVWWDPLPARKLVDPEAYQSLIDLYGQVVAEQGGMGRFSRAILRRLAELVAIQFARLVSGENSPTDKTTSITARRILTVKAWIDRHFSEECSLSDLATMAHFSPSHFSAAFSETVGMSPMAYVRSRRLEQAMLLLAQTTQPVKEIALGVGFHQAAQFNHAFKVHAGMTPLDYRRKAQ